jgi:ribosome-associated protein
MYQAKSLAKKIAKMLDGIKGEDIKLYDVSNLTPLARFYIVVSCSSARKVAGYQAECEKVIEESGGTIKHIEGEADSPWVVIDAADIVVHIMSEHERERLNFDALYEKCPEVDFHPGQKGKWEE